MIEAIFDHQHRFLTTLEREFAVVLDCYDFGTGFGTSIWSSKASRHSMMCPLGLLTGHFDTGLCKVMLVTKWIDIKEGSPRK